MTPTTPDDARRGAAGEPIARLLRLGSVALAAVGLGAVLLAIDVAGLSDPHGPTLRVAALLLLVSGLLVLLFSTRATRRAHEAARNLDATFENLNLGVAIYDRDDRLIRCNRTFRSYFPEVADRMQPGVHYDELMRAYYPLAPAEVVDGRSLDEFIATAKARRHGQRASEVVRRHRNGWLLLTDAVMADGGRVS
nr:PAS-domain containing protein [Burkholderiaceae bacterium]